MNKILILIMLLLTTNGFCQTQFHASLVFEENYSDNLIGPVKLNNSGLVVGTINWKAFSFDIKESKLSFLPKLDGISSVSDLNDHGDIIGFVEVEVYKPNFGRSQEIYPCIWKEGGIINLNDKLGTYSVHYGHQLHINNNNLISGYGLSCFSNTSNFWERYSSLTFDLLTGKIKNLIHPNNNNNRALSQHYVIKNINNKNSCIVGLFNSNNFNSSPIYSCLLELKNGNITHLGNLIGEEKYYCHAVDLNDFNQIVGESEINIKANGSYLRHAFLWDKGKMFDLGVLHPNHNSIAIAINNLGDVIGNVFDNQMVPFIWNSVQGMQNLNDLIDNPDEFFIREAIDLNDNRQIICKGLHNGKQSLIFLELKID